jgi:hypothetical protein
MDYTQIQAAKEAGTITISAVSEQPKPIPSYIMEERISVTAKKFDPYTGKEVNPEVTNYRKSDLLRDIESINQQIAILTERKAAINALLVEFSV